jgi:hypothetical protein
LYRYSELKDALFGLYAVPSWRLAKRPLKNGIHVLGTGKAGSLGNLLDRQSGRGKQLLGRAQLLSLDLVVDRPANDASKPRVERRARNIFLPRTKALNTTYSNSGIFAPFLNCELNSTLVRRRAISRTHSSGSIRRCGREAGGLELGDQRQERETDLARGRCRANCPCQSPTASQRRQLPDSERERRCWMIPRGIGIGYLSSIQRFRFGSS